MTAHSDPRISRATSNPHSAHVLQAISFRLCKTQRFNTADPPQSPAKLFYLFSIWSMLREALVSADGHHIQNYGGGLGKRSAALVAVNGGAVNIQDHATANARPQVPLTSSALKARSTRLAGGGKTL